MKSLFILSACFLFILTISAFTDYSAPPLSLKPSQLSADNCPNPSQVGSTLNVNEARTRQYGTKLVSIPNPLPSGSAVAGPGDDLQQKINTLCGSDCNGKTLYLREGRYFVSELEAKEGLRIVGEKKNSSTGVKEVIFLGTRELDPKNWTALPSPVSNNLVKYKYNSPVSTGDVRSNKCDPGLPSEYSTCNFSKDLFFGSVWGAQVKNESNLNEDKEWTFYNGTIYICSSVPPSSINMQISDKTWAMSNDKRPSNVEIRNIVFRGYTRQAMRTNDKWKIRDCKFTDCHLNGIAVVGNNVEVKGCEFSRNGRTGIDVSQDEGSPQSTGILITENLLKENNQAGYDHNDHAGGIKATRTYKMIVSRNYALNNNGPGFWSDVESKQDSIVYNLIESIDNSQNNNNSRLYNLLRSRKKQKGIYYEISAGDSETKKSKIQHNVIINGENGIHIRSSAYVGVYRNTIKNALNGILVTEDNRGKDASYITITYNEVAQNGDMRLAGIEFTGTKGPHDINWFYSSAAKIQFNYNIYYHSQSNPAFMWSQGSSNMGIIRWAPKEGKSTHWQANQDQNSCFQQYKDIVAWQGSNASKILEESLPDLTSAEVVTSYPDPFNEALHVPLSDSMSQERLQIKLVDLTGRIYTIPNERLRFTEQEVEIQTDDLPAGVYILSLEEGNQRHQIRVIKD